MDLATHVRRTNRAMAVFDLALGLGTLLAPAQTLRVLGHAAPSPDAQRLFQRNAPVWLTFAAAHAVAATRDRPQDWWALAWLRSTELFTDALWSGSPAVTRPGAKITLRAAGVGNALLAGSFAWLSNRRGS